MDHISEPSENDQKRSAENVSESYDFEARLLNGIIRQVLLFALGEDHPALVAYRRKFQSTTRPMVNAANKLPHPGSKKHSPTCSVL